MPLMLLSQSFKKVVTVLFGISRYAQIGETPGDTRYLSSKEADGGANRPVT